MKITIVSFVMTAAFGLIACDNTKHNTLTEQEKAEGWELSLIHISEPTRRS